jgi:hypothetical protein
MVLRPVELSPRDETGVCGEGIVSASWDDWGLESS